MPEFNPFKIVRGTWPVKWARPLVILFGALYVTGAVLLLYEFANNIWGPLRSYTELSDWNNFDLVLIVYIPVTVLLTAILGILAEINQPVQPEQTTERGGESRWRGRILLWAGFAAAALIFVFGVLTKQTLVSSALAIGILWASGFPIQTLLKGPKRDKD